MMRFLHLADVHLDTPFAGRAPAVRRRLRAAVREAFERAVDLALDEDLDALVIAGDLFDSDTLSFETERFVITQFERLVRQRIAVVYATGNHDPGVTPGRRTAIRWPEGVTVADGPAPVRTQVHDRSGRLAGWITAVGHASPREGSDLTRHFPRPDGLFPEVAVLHAQVESSHDAASHDRYAPTTIEAMRSKSYDYWALGHVHRRQELHDEPAIHYPGNIQGRTPAESGPRGALIVDLESGHAPRVVFRSLAPVRWETVEVSGLSEVDSLDGLVRAITRRWHDRLEAEAGSQAEWMLRVRLLGGTPLWRLLRDPAEVATVETELVGELDLLDAVIEAGSVHAPVDPANHRPREDALGWALRELEAIVSGKALPEATLRGLQGFDDREESLEAYLAKTLEGADAELVTRLLGSS